jgi:hypothetical protein
MLLLDTILTQATSNLTPTPLHMIAGFFIVGFIALCTIVILTHRKYTARNNELKQLQQQYAAKIELLNKNHNETLDKIRENIMKHEEERTFQWIESEKETLNVLSGLTTLLDMNEKLGRVESEKILEKIQEAESIILSKIKLLNNNE